MAISIDFKACPYAHHNVIIDSTEQAFPLDKIKAVLTQEFILKGVFCAAGGWTMGDWNSRSTLFEITLFSHLALIEDGNRMWHQNCSSALASVQLASELKCAKPPLIVLVAAQAALSPTPTCLAYGMCKAALLHLHCSMATQTRMITLCPIILDTPSNRQSFPPKADYSSWTPCEYIAQ